MTFLAGQVLTADALNRQAPIYVTKAADTSRASTTVMAADPDLVLTLLPNTVYEVYAHIGVSSSSAAGDFQCDWAATGDVTDTISRSCTGPGQNTTSSSANAAAAATVGITKATCHSLTTDVEYGLDGTNVSAIQETFIVTTGALGGTLTFRWSQRASSATAVTVEAVRSYIRAMPIG